MTASKKIVVTVTYWRGTLRCEGKATTYRGAMRLASRSQNAYSPRFHDQDGRRLYDTGAGLAYETTGDTVYCVL